MYVQRRRPPPESFRLGALWRPEVRAADGSPLPITPQPTDAYVVVDEIVADRVGLVASPWPNVDEAGRLRFRKVGAVQRRTYARERIQGVLDRLRRSKGQIERPLRVGDTFWVRGLSGNPEGWKAAIDVTGAARQAAKTALLRAIAYPAIAGPRPEREPRSSRRRSRARSARFPEGRQDRGRRPEGEGFSPGSVAPPSI